MKKLSVKQIKEKVHHLKSERGTWETHWQEIADFIVPRKNTITNQKTPGQKRSVQVVDSTGIQSNELLAGALHGLLTNPNAFWFELTTGDVKLDREDDVRMFLQESTRSIHNVLNNSNFQTEIHELYIDICAFGTSCMYIEEDSRDTVRFSTKFIAEFMVEENSRGQVDQIYREWHWSATKLVQEFGITKVSKKVREAYEKGKEDKFCVHHAVYSREMVDPNHRSAFKFISQYTLPDCDHELKEEGYREFPYVVPRFTKAAGEKYGRSPGMNALPEVKTLNKMTETMIIGAQKVVDPPVQMPDDGFIMPIVVLPGGINYYRSGTQDFIKPIFNDTRIDFGYQAMDERRKRVRESFYVDQLQLQQGPQMTATEVLQRTEEKMRLLGPMLGRQQSELLRPLIDRTFDIMVRQGKIDMTKIPTVLKGKKIDVKYSSLIAKSQRLAEGQNLLRVMEAVTPFANADASVLDNINGDQAFRVIADVYGLPQEVIRTQKEVDGKRKARAEAQQAALDQERARQQTDAAPKMADTMAKLSQTGQ